MFSYYSRIKTIEQNKVCVSFDLLSSNRYGARCDKQYVPFYVTKLVWTFRFIRRFRSALVKKGTD